MSLGKRIKKIRKLLKLSRNDFEPNISSSTLRHWESGNYEPKDKSLLELIEVFKRNKAYVSTTWLKTGNAPVPKINNKIIDSEYFTEEENDQDEDEILEKDESLFRDINHIKIIYNDLNNHDRMLIYSSEMSPHFKVGDYVFGTEINIKDFKIIDLEPAIVTLINGKKYLCYFSYNRDRNKLSFVYEHGNVPFTKIEISKISIVVLHRRCILLPSLT